MKKNEIEELKNLIGNNCEWNDVCAVGPLINRIVALENALREIMTVDCAYPQFGGTPCCIYIIAKAALEEKP